MPVIEADLCGFLSLVVLSIESSVVLLVLCAKAWVIKSRSTPVCLICRTCVEILIWTDGLK